MDRQTRLRQMLNPRSAVFIGGSNLIPAINYCRKNRFKGPIYVVNPFKARLTSIACHPTLVDLPEVPDLAFIGVPKEAVVETIHSLSRLGVAGAVVNSAGFSEIEGAGVERQSAFVDAAGTMPVLGPNCPGFANFVDGAVFMQDHFGDHAEVRQGVAVISNGGAYLSDAGCADRSVPVAYLVGLGNQAVLSVANIFEVVLDDPRVKAVNLYLESLQDVPKLSACALKAARQGIPVVAVKGGRSRAGQRATQSHTASLAGDEVVASAMFERFGFIEARTTAEALETLKMLIFTARPRGRRLAFTTSSGSYAVIGADVAEAVGLDIPALDPATRQQLDSLLPDYIRAANPLDISNGQFFEADHQRKIFATFLADEFDLAVQVMCFPPVGGWDDSSWHITSEAFAKTATARELPVAFVATMAEGLPLKARQQMIANGMAPLLGMEHGFQAIANSVRGAELAERLSDLDDQAILLTSAGRPHQAASPHTFDEAGAKELLHRAGIAVPQAVVWDGVAEADLTDLPFPVAVKALSPQLIHKTDLGAVALNLETPDEIYTTITTMRRRLASAQPALQIDGFLIEHMITDGVAELIIGLRRVEAIGLALTIGFGGIGVELLSDTATLLLPAPRSEIEWTLRRLKQFPLLTGWRGRPAANLERVLNTLENIVTIALDNVPRLVELEINPLIVRPGDKDPVVVDAVLKMEGNQIY